MNETDNTVVQDTNAFDSEFEAGFFNGMSEEYEEDQAEEQDTNAFEPQEEESEESAEEQDTNADEESAEEETTNEQTEEKTEETAQSEPEVLEVTFLGEVKQLSREEAVSWAQKGMNADHQQQQSNAKIAMLEAELSAPRAGDTVMPLIKAYAQSMGSNLEELTQNMLQAVRAAGITVEKPTQSNYMREKAVKDWQDFMQAYPEIRDPKLELAPEVWNAIKGGLTPRAAYIEHKQKGFEKAMADKDAVIAEKDSKIADLEQKIKTLELNEKNRKKSVSGLKSSVESPNRDEFFEGYMRGY